MEPKAFVAEVYRRMSVVYELQLKQQNQQRKIVSATEFFRADPALWEHLCLNYQQRLPSNKEVAILDIGSGNGSFLAACSQWGYRNLAAMDYNVDRQAEQFKLWGVSNTYKVTTDLPTSLSQLKGQFDVIHAAHLIEHIPKHDLLENIDAMFYALKPGGLLLLETPNLLSPVGAASLYCTLGHEYGFSEVNLDSLLNLAGFQQVKVFGIRMCNSKLKWKIANVARWLFLLRERVKHQLFGWPNSILAVSILGQGVRPNIDPLPARDQR